MKVAVVGYDINPVDVSESVVAAEWLRIIDRHHTVTAITDERHRIGLLSGNYPNTRFVYIKTQPKVRRFERISGLRGLGAKRFFARAKQELIEAGAGNFDVIHCLTPFGIYATNSLYELEVPVLVGPLGGGLVTPRNFGRAFRRQPLRTYGRDALYKLLLRRHKWKNYMANASLILVGTEYVRSLIPGSLHDRCIRMFDTVVDTERFTPGIGRRPGPVRLLFVGRLEGTKGPQLLIEACRRCVERGVSDFVVEMIGAGRLRRSLERDAAKAGLEGIVQIVGRLTREDVITHYQQADIFCLPTLREPGGTAILEAMACGLPVITSNYGGPRDVVTPECGIRIEMHGYEDYVERLAESLVYMIENPHVRRRMGDVGRRRVEQEYSAVALEGRVVKLYDCVHKNIIKSEKGSGVARVGAGSSTKSVRA